MKDDVRGKMYDVRGKMASLLRRASSILLLAILFCCSCRRGESCDVPIGLTNFKIEPNSAYHSGLNSVGGYEYLTGGHRGVVVVRLAYDQFVAFERTCPIDHNSSVEVVGDWGGSLLECPSCHTLFVTANDGLPLDGGATTCPLYQYSTYYRGGVLEIY